jgi:hypothetical protein
MVLDQLHDLAIGAKRKCYEHELKLEEQEKD